MISLKNIDPIYWFLISECIGVIIIIVNWGLCYSKKWRRRILDFWIPVVVFFVIIFFLLVKMEEETMQGDMLRLTGSVGAVILGLWVYRFQRRLLLTQIMDRVSGELGEIYRHLGANILVLKNIDSSKGIPSLLHIRKLEITKYSSLSDKDVLKNLDQCHNEVIFPMTVRIRNYNINVREIVNYLETEHPNEKIFNEHKQGIIDVTENLRVQIKDCIGKLDINKRDFIEKKSDTKRIIYDKKW